MKKLLSIILLCMIFLGSFLLSGCKKPVSEEARKNEETTRSREQSESVSEPDTQKTLNGMTAAQLYENFINEYTNASTYDISLRSTVRADGAEMTALIDLKLGEDAMYIRSDVDDAEMECWFFDDVSYFNVGGEKYKATGATVNDIFGEGFVEATLSSAFSGIDQAFYTEKLNGIELYSENGEYYYSLKLTDKEAEELEIGEKNYSETVFFDAEGKVRKIVSSSDSGEAVLMLNAYGDTVEIALPADHESYVEPVVPDDEEEKGEDTELPDEDAGSQDPLMYAEYKKIFETLKNAKKFYMIKNTNGSTERFYTKVGGDEYTRVLSNNESYERWYINGVGYACDGSEKAHTAEVTAEFLSCFEAARAEVEFICGKRIHGDDMKNVDHVKDYSWADLAYTYDIGEGAMERYEIRYFYDMSRISIKITQLLNGEDISSVEYSFIDIDSMYLENIISPI